MLSEPQILDKLSNKDADGAQGRRQVVRQGAGRQYRGLLADHQHAGQGQGDRGPLAQVPAAAIVRATSPTWSRTRWSMRWSSSVKAAYPRLSHRYYKLKAKWFGVETMPYWDRNAPLPEHDDRTIPWAEAEKIVLDAYDAFSPELADGRPEVLRHRLDRRAGAAGQVAGRLRPSDRAVGASLSAAELPGQGARRDDAGARAGPWRAPGAGGAAGRR